MWLLLGLFGLATGLWGAFRRRESPVATIDPRLGLTALGLLFIATLIGASGHYHESLGPRPARGIRWQHFDVATSLLCNRGGSIDAARRQRSWVMRGR